MAILANDSDKQLHTGIHRIEGRFQFNTASAPTNLIGRGIASVAHTGTGIWTVTLDSSYQSAVGLVCATSSLELDANSDESVIQQGAYTVATATLVIRVFTGAATLAAADLAPGSNNGNWCHLNIVLKLSDSEDGSGLV